MHQIHWKIWINPATIKDIFIAFIWWQRNNFVRQIHKKFYAAIKDAISVIKYMSKWIVVLSQYNFVSWQF